jgi:hypothetical protein
MTSVIYTAAAVDVDAAVAINEAMSQAVRAAEQAHPDGFTISAISHDSQLVENSRTVEPSFFAAATGRAAVTVQDQRLLVTVAIVVQADAQRSS